MNKAQHDPHDLAQWLLSRDGDLANLAGRELQRALDRAEKAELTIALLEADDGLTAAYMIGAHAAKLGAWNDAIEAALLIAGGFAGVDCNPEMVEAISILKKED